MLQGFEIDTLDFIFKKSAHIFVYAVLYFLFLRASTLVLSPKLKHSNWVWIVPFCITMVYAISDELHQTFVPGRTGTIRDLGFDMIGMGLVFLYKYRYI